MVGGMGKSCDKGSNVINVCFQKIFLDDGLVKRGKLGSCSWRFCLRSNGLRLVGLSHSSLCASRCW